MPLCASEWIISVFSTRLCPEHCYLTFLGLPSLCIPSRRRSIENRMMILQLLPVDAGPITALCLVMRWAGTVRLKQSGFFLRNIFSPDLTFWVHVAVKITVLVLASNTKMQLFLAFKYTLF